MTHVPPSPGLTNWIRIIVIAIIWGGAFGTVRLALETFPPTSVAAYRILIGALALYALMRWKGISFPDFTDKRLWAMMIWIAVLSTALPFFLLGWGQQHVPSAFAGMSMAVVPLFVLPLAHIFVPGEQMSLRKSLGFGIGFIGTVVLIGTSGLGRIDGPIEFWARAACVTASICYAANSIVTKKCPPVNELALSTVALMLASIVMVPLALFVDGVPTKVTWEGGLSILYLGLIPTALAFIIKVAVIRSAGPSFMSLTNYQVPVWSVLFGLLFWSEALPPQLFVALLLIFTGIAISQWATLRRLFSRS